MRLARAYVRICYVCDPRLVRGSVWLWGLMRNVALAAQRVHQGMLNHKTAIQAVAKQTQSVAKEVKLQAAGLKSQKDAILKMQKEMQLGREGVEKSATSGKAAKTARRAERELQEQSKGLETHKEAILELQDEVATLRSRARTAVSRRSTSQPPVKRGAKAAREVDTASAATTNATKATKATDAANVAVNDEILDTRSELMQLAKKLDRLQAKADGVKHVTVDTSAQAGPRVKTKSKANRSWVE